MSIPELTPTLLTAPQDAADAPGSAAPRPTLIVGPSLGTGVRELWEPAVPHLRGHMQVIGWDLPGHGVGAPAAESFSVAELAAAVATMIERLCSRGVVDASAGLAVAGVSLGGAVTLQLGADRPGLADALAMFCSAARIGTAESWHERAELVERAGTPTMVAGSTERWFAPGFLAAQPRIATNLLHSLQHADRHSYAHACRALADFDLRERLGEISDPLLAVAGAHDAVTPPADAEAVAAGAAQGRGVVVDGAAHLVPAEAPEETARLLRELLAPLLAEGEASSGGTSGAAAGGAAAERLPGDPYDAGMRVRREVLSDAHVDRAQARTTDFTADFQELITRYAWGSIWTRDGLPRTTRSAITLTALIAGGCWEELEMHVRAARRNGMTVAEIKEVFLQAAIYCGVPAANTAFSIGQQVLDEDDDAG